MKQNELNKITIALKDFPVNLARPFKVLLEANNVRKKINARSSLVKLCNSIIHENIMTNNNFNN